MTTKRSPAFDEGLELLLHRVVLNMSECARGLGLFVGHHHKLRQAEIRTELPCLVKLLLFGVIRGPFDSARLV